MKFWIWLFAAMILVFCVGLIVRRKKKQDENRPPDDIYPLW